MIDKRALNCNVHCYSSTAHMAQIIKFAVTSFLIYCGLKVENWLDEIGEILQVSGFTVADIAEIILLFILC